MSYYLCGWPMFHDTAGYISFALRLHQRGTARTSTMAGTEYTEHPHVCEIPSAGFQGGSVVLRASLFSLPCLADRPLWPPRYQPSTVGLLRPSHGHPCEDRTCCGSTQYTSTSAGPVPCVLRAAVTSLHYLTSVDHTRPRVLGPKSITDVACRTTTRLLPDTLQHSTSSVSH